MSDEKRQDVRIPVRVTVVLQETTFDGTLYFSSSNLSVGGMFLEADILLQEGSIVSLQFSLPNGGTPIRAVARIARVVDSLEDGVSNGFGVEFLEMDLSSREQLKGFVVRSI